MALITEVDNTKGPWHTPETARVEWVDAESFEDSILTELLEIARMQVLAFAPSIPQDIRPGAFGETEFVPVNYRRAQLQQARNVWNAANTSPGGDFGTDSYVIQPRPLDWHVKALLRPTRGRPSIR